MYIQTHALSSNNMSSLSEREGLDMDSSIFSDDDSLDWRWPASSPRRCDRECANALLGKNEPARPSSCSCSSSSSSNIKEPFFYCTEELGSESTSGVVDLCIAPISYNFSINEKMTSSSSFLTTAPNTTTNRHSLTYEKEYMTSVNATTSGRSTDEGLNWEFKQQACASTMCIKATNPEVKGASCSSTKISSHGHMFDSNSPHHHHCRAVSGSVNRTFPPPISSLLTDRPLMRSFKSNGRFVLKKVDNVSRSLFRFTRKNGRLRLDLLPSSFDCLESQYGALLSASSAETSDFTHDFESTHHHCLRTPSPYSILHHKPTLNYETLCPPSKLKAFVMLLHSKGSCSPFIEESISASSTSFPAGQTGGNTAMAQYKPHVFALLKLLPSGLGLIIFEIRKVKGGDLITLHGMYILKNFGFQCSRAAMSPGHHLLTNSFGISSEDSKGKLFSFEDCKKERYT